MPFGKNRKNGLKVMGKGQSPCAGWIKNGEECGGFMCNEAQTEYLR